MEIKSPNEAKNQHKIESLSSLTVEISVSVLALKHSTQLSHTANIESGIRRCVSVSLEKQSILYVMTERVNHYEKTGMIFTGTSYMCYKWKLFLAEVSLLNQM